jgi:hypothetical protein
LTSKILPFGLSNADHHGFSSIACRWSHEFRPNWVANIFAKNGFNSGKIAFSERPADYLPDRRELFWTTRTPESDSNTWLVSSQRTAK